MLTTQLIHLTSLAEWLSVCLRTKWLCVRIPLQSLKVARVVNIKLSFMDWFLYYLIILIKQWKISYENFDKALLFSRNLVFCLRNWKLWRAPTVIEFNIFCWRFAHMLPMKTIFTKRCMGLFLFCLYLESLTCKNQKRPGFYKLTKTRSFTFVLIPQDLNKIKKIPNNTLLYMYLLNRKLVQTFRKNIKF